MKVLAEKLLDAVTLASSVNSRVLDIQGIYCYSIVDTVTGSVFAGTYVVQVSNDDVQDPSLIANWANDGSAVTISAAGSVATNFDGRAYKWARVAFNQNSGTGALTINFHGKGA